MTGYLLIFLYGFVIDFAWGWYIVEVNEGNKMRASVASILVAVPSMLGMLAILENRYYMGAYALGLGAGTYAVLTIKGLKCQRN